LQWIKLLKNRPARKRGKNIEIRKYTQCVEEHGYRAHGLQVNWSGWGAP